MTTVTNDNRNPVKQPTPRGVEDGISIEQRQSQDHVYTIILYDQQAQQLILDHLNAIVDLSQRSKNKATTLRGASWTPAHDEALITLIRKQAPLGELP